VYASKEDAIADIRERAKKTGSMGYLPKQKPLLYMIDYLEMDKLRLKEELERETDPARKQRITIALHKLDAKIELCADWLRVQDRGGDWGMLVIGKEGREPKMPTFGTRAEVDLHIKNRHLGIGMSTEEEMKEGRIKRYRDDAERISRAIDHANRQAED